MWQVGEQKIKKIEDYNKYIESLSGKTLNEHEAKITLSAFLRSNIAFTFELISGVKLLPFQEVVLKSLFLADNCLFVAGRGLSKCIDVDSLVLTEGGLKKIKDVNVGEKIQSKNSLNEIQAKTINPEEDGFEITSQKRYTFKGKIGHKTLILNQDKCELEYKNIENITKDDLLVLRRGMGVWGNNDVFTGFDFETITDTRRRKITPKNEPDFYYLLGLLFGDGCMRNDWGAGMSLTSGDEDVLKFGLTKLQEYLPDTSVYIRDKDGTDAKAVCFSNVRFVEFLKHIGINTQARAHEKTIPFPLLSCKKEYVAGIIRGLFDTDGWISLKINEQKNSQTVSIGFSSSSLELINTVQTVLLNFGITSGFCYGHKGGEFVIMGVKCNTQPAYKLHISSYENIQKFYQEIGFGIGRKNKILVKYLDEYKKDKDFNSFLLPVGIYLKKKYLSNQLGKAINQRFKIHKNLSIGRIRQLLEANAFDEKDTLFFNDIINNNLSFEKIREIKPIKTTTVDIQVKNEECYWSNGFIHHNSFLISVFSILYPIFYPGSRLGIISQNFRSARRVIDESEKLVLGKKANLLRACYEGSMLARRNDEYKWKLNNGSEVVAIPLSSDQMRGYRFRAVLLDEAVVVPKNIQEDIIRPFLTVKQDFREQEEIKEAEDYLINKGVITERERISFPRNKFLAFSSASYKFEYLYETWMNSIEAIIKPPIDDPDPPRSVCIRMSYEVMPEKGGFLDMTQINTAKAYGENSDSFKKEYRALFSDVSDSFFNPKKMHECTIPLGEYPCVQIRGDKGVQYLLSIDPSYSASKSSDFFAMGVYMLIPEKREICLVHQYAKAGGKLEEHFAYLTYLLTHFDINFVVIDGSATEFIDGYNQSSIAKDRNISVNFVDDIDFDTAENYIQEVQRLRTIYNLKARKFVYAQKFTSQSIRSMNDTLQIQINAKKVWFASAINGNSTEYEKALKFEFPFQFKDKKDQDYSAQNFLDDQDHWIRECKKQTALIEVKATALGHLTFDLPQNIRRSDSPDRPRKDLYTCLLMANYASKFYFDMLFQPESNILHTFTPIIIK